MSFDKDWRDVKLGDIVDIVSGGTPKTAISEYWEPDEINWITAKDVSSTDNRTIMKTKRKISILGLENSAARLLEPLTTVLIARGATTGRVALSQEGMAMNQTCYGLQSKHGTDKLFIYYLMLSRYNNFKSIANGSVFDTVIGSGIKSIPLRIPDYPVQQAIGQMLGVLDDKIELNKAINKNLEDMAQTLFKRWFVDFEFPDESREPYKSSGGEFEESELGLIPKGWSVAEMGSFLSSKNERDNDRNLIPYSTTNQGLQLRDEKFKKNLTNNNSKNKVIEKNDIVFGMSREILNFGVMKDDIGAVSPAYHVFKVDCEVYQAELLEMYMRLRSDHFLDLIKPGAREGQGIDQAHLQKKRLIVPKGEVQGQFNVVSSSIKETIQTVEEQIISLTKIRDSLLPKLMSGELRVPVEQV